MGTLINTDPGEGRFPPSPGLGDRYWYPVYETLCELDVPMFIHSTNCLAPARETYGTHFILEETVGIVTLINSEVLEDFPELKVIVSHGGGAIPFQLGRFESMSIQDVFGPGKGDFFEKLRRIWFDTCLYSPQALGLLFETVGADRCCFGTEKPGTGSQINLLTGSSFDEIKPLIEEHRLAERSGSRRDLRKERGRAVRARGPYQAVGEGGLSRAGALGVIVGSGSASAAARAGAAVVRDAVVVSGA